MTAAAQSTKVVDLHANLAELERRKVARPLDFARMFGWQKIVAALCGGSTQDWDSEWGPAPSVIPREVYAICPNQVGKTTLEGWLAASHALGRLERWKQPGTIWLGMPSFDEACEVQRPAVAEWLGDGDYRYQRDRQKWRGRSIAVMQDGIETRAGWAIVSKAYKQGEIGWTGDRIQGAILDEPGFEELLPEIKQRLMRHEGYVLGTMTPIHGTSSSLHGALCL